MIPRISPMLIPQLAFLVPSYIFLEATLAIFGLAGSTPSWGSLVYQALREAPLQDNFFWIAEPIALLVLTGLGFALLASALERTLDRDPGSGLLPRLKK
jgi:peptide/nickel transport system permease protein